MKTPNPRNPGGNMICPKTPEPCTGGTGVRIDKFARERRCAGGPKNWVLFGIIQAGFSHASFTVHSGGNSLVVDIFLGQNYASLEGRVPLQSSLGSSSTNSSPGAAGSG